MATTKVIELMRRAGNILNDAGAVRWTRLELQDGLNDGYRETVAIRPDANAQTSTVLLAAGTRQRLSDVSSINLPNAIRVLDVVRNMAATSNKRAIRLVDRKTLDDQSPLWHAEAQSVNVAHWMFDIKTPKEFLVYPPATSLAQVELAYSTVPAAHALTESQLDPANLNAAVINLDDIYANSLLDYMLYRAFLKDSAHAANAQRAAIHKAAFDASLGVKTQADVASAPTK